MARRGISSLFAKAAGGLDDLREITPKMVGTILPFREERLGFGNVRTAKFDYDIDAWLRPDFQESH